MPPQPSFIPFLLNFCAHFRMSSSSPQSADPPEGTVGMYRGWIPPRAALEWARRQRTQGYLPHYNPLLARPSVCSRLEKIQF